MRKKDTVYTYLKEVMTLNLQIIISNYFLRGVEIDLFFKVFSNVEKDPKSVAEFILDGNNFSNVEDFYNEIDKH